jgi:hypothetical protein
VNNAFLSILLTHIKFRRQLKLSNKFLTLAVVFIIIFPTDTPSMQLNIFHELKRDRLFGKELTNLLDQKPAKRDGRIGYLRKEVMRGISEEMPKRNTTNIIKTSRAPEPTTRNNISVWESKDQNKDTTKDINILGDLQFVPEYFEENLRFMIQQESRREMLSCSLSHQKDLSEGMRMILYDWLVDVHLKLRMFPQTLFITCNLIDRFLGKKDINRSKLQLLGVTCLFIAAKYEETY